MGTIVFFNDQMRALLCKGVNKIANAVKVTLGPKGRTVIISHNGHSHHITKDGVTVARSVSTEDEVEDLGCRITREVASKTADDAGDGTTTATVLAQALVNVGLKNVTAGANPMDIKRGIDKAVIKVVESLKQQSESVSGNFTKIEQVATISANNDSEIGKLIAEAMEKVKKEGVITVEEAKGIETTVEVVEGMQFDRGYISPYFINTPDRMEATFEKPLVLITDSKISTVKDMLPALEMVSSAGRSVLIIADEVSGEALATLVVNNGRGNLRAVAVTAPSFGDARKEIMEDIAAITGATVVSSDKGIKLDSISYEMLGSAEKVIVSKNNTTIINGFGSRDAIDTRASNLRERIKTTDSESEALILQERLAKITGGVAVLYVGAATETEMKEKKDRVDDALRATRAAVEEGIVPGGGVAYIRAIDALEGLKGDNDDETTGMQIVKRAIEEPLRQIVANAGLEGSVIVQKVREGKADYGYNARTDKYENLLQSGVIDPTKVTRVALENAASIAGMILTSECVIASKNQ